MIGETKYKEWGVSDILDQIMAFRTEITDEVSFKNCSEKILLKKHKF